MTAKIYLGNLSLDVTENDLRDMLSPHGPVNEISVVMDKITGRARGFAFATMNTEEAAKAAILALNGKDWKGRLIELGLVAVGARALSSQMEQALARSAG